MLNGPKVYVDDPFRQFHGRKAGIFGAALMQRLCEDMLQRPGHAGFAKEVFTRGKFGPEAGGMTHMKSTALVLRVSQHRTVTTQRQDIQVTSPAEQYQPA